MQAKSWALALALALATTTVAESRPRIYFPRHVKRQFSNGVETRDEIFPPASTPAPKSGDERNRQNDNQGSGSNADVTDGFIQGKDGDSGSDPLATRSDDSVIVLNIPNTVVVQSTNPPSNNENGPQGAANTDEDSQPRPTPPPGSESKNGDDNTGTNDSPVGSLIDSLTDSLTGSNSKDSDDGVTITPTGVVSEENSGDLSDDSNGQDDASDDTSDNATDQDTTVTDPTDNGTTESPTGDADQSTGNDEDVTDITDSIGQGTGDTPGPTDTTDPADDTPAEEEPKDTEDDNGGILGDILGGILGPGKNSTTPDTNEPTGDDTGDSEQLPTLPGDSDETDITPPIEDDDDDDDSGNSGNGNSDDDDETGDDEPPTPVITPPPTLTDPPVLDPGEIISSIIDDLPIPLPPVVNNTDPLGNGTDGDGDGSDDDDGTITLPDINLPTDVPDNQDPDGGIIPGDSSTQPPDPQPTPGGSTPGGEETTPPTVTVPGTDAPPTPPPTSFPDTGDDGEGEESSELPHSTLPVGNGTNVSGGQGEPTQAPGPTVVEPVTPVTSIAVVSTVTGTPDWLGTELVADKTASTQEQSVAAPAPTQSTETLPAGMPKTIEATEDDNPVQPEGSQLIRVVFDRRLHYEFVADNFTAAQQILTFLPKIIAFGENIEESKIQMMRLAPVNSKNNGWFPTGAYLYVPTSVIAPLSADIHLPNSLLYHHEYPVAFQLASAIDPSFGIMPASEGDVQGDEAGPGGAPFSNSEDKPEEQTPQQRGATAGIAMGAVTVAVAYGAAMFIVARRYKRKKQAHRRASSITNTSDMRYSPSGSPAMMGGALLSRDFSGYGGVGGVPGGRESHGSGRSGAGNSGRTAYISAPVAAENSLGWN